MVNPESPLLEDAKRELAGLGKELRQMAALRWQLALMEFRAAAAQGKRLAVIAGTAAVAGLSALAVLVVYAAEMLQGLWLSRAGWLLTFGLGLLAASALGGWLAARNFRRRFVGLEETLEEIREDLVWLQEWLASRPGP